MIRIAIPTEESLKSEALGLLQRIGLGVPLSINHISVSALNFPAEIVFLPEIDILPLTENGFIDLGIVSHYYQTELDSKVSVLRYLGIGYHNISITTGNITKYRGVETLNGKSIITAFPSTLTKFLKVNNIHAKVVGVAPSAVSTTRVGFTDFYCEAIPEGLSYTKEILKEVEIIDKSEAILVNNQQLSIQKQTILEEFLFRFDATLKASSKRLISMHVPTENINSVLEILPSLKKPTILPIDKHWNLVQVVMEDTRFWDIVAKLKQLKAADIVVMPIEQLIL